MILGIQFDILFVYFTLQLLYLVFLYVVKLLPISQCYNINMNEGQLIRYLIFFQIKGICYSNFRN